MSACANCGAPATKRCGRCKSVEFCSENCQRVYWKRGHKKAFVDAPPDLGSIRLSTPVDANPLNPRSAEFRLADLLPHMLAGTTGFVAPVSPEDRAEEAGPTIQVEMPQERAKVTKIRARVVLLPTFRDLLARTGRGIVTTFADVQTGRNLGPREQNTIKLAMMMLNHWAKDEPPRAHVLEMIPRCSQRVRLFPICKNQPVSMLAAAIAGPFVGNAQCVPSRDMQMKVLDAVRFCIRELRCDGNEPTGNPLFVVNPNMDIKNPESIFFDGQCPAVSVDTEIVRPLHILSQITGPRAICYAVALEIGQCLVEGGADPDGVNNTGHTPLIAALFEEVTRPDFKGNESNRPHYIGIVGLVRMLLTLGAKPNLPSTSPSSLISPLSVAVMLSGDEQAVAVGRLLLEGGADFTPVSYPYTREGPDGEDILLAFDYLKVAVKMGRVAFVKFALTEAKLDADIQLPSFYFVPLLIYAVMEGFVPMVRMLLENGATVSKETWGCASGMLKDARKGHHVPHGFSDSELARRRALGSRVLPTVEERGRSFGSWSKRWTGARCFEAFAFGRGRDRDRWK